MGYSARYTHGVRLSPGYFTSRNAPLALLRFCLLNYPDVLTYCVLRVCLIIKLRTPLLVLHLFIKEPRYNTVWRKSPLFFSSHRWDSCIYDII